MLERLVWAEINLSHYTSNFREVQKCIGAEVKIMAIVKANAYGHGAISIAKKAEEIGASYLGAVCLLEARQLREARIKLPILILNYTDPESVKTAVDLDLSLTVMDEEVLKAIDVHARKVGKKIKIHVKIDTGMHRLGLLPQNALTFIPEIEKYKNVELEGIFTHFATSDESDLAFTREQLAVFMKLLEKVKTRGIAVPLIHAANSAATLRLSSTHFDMVRPGIILYGLGPSSDFPLPFTPKPILSLKTKIVQIRRIGKGETVGYGRTFKAQKEMLVASLPVGYADGFRRAPENWGFVLVKGKRVALLGRVSMDQSSIDVTGIPNVVAGDEVVLIGKQEGEYISAEEVAERLGTINYEVVSTLAARVSRVYTT